MEVDVQQVVVASVVAGATFLLRRAISGVDKGLASLSAEVAILTKLINDNNVRLAEQGMRINALEHRLSRVEEHQTDFGGFLASQGFRRRDGRDGE